MFDEILGYNESEIFHFHNTILVSVYRVFRFVLSVEAIVHRSLFSLV